MKKHLEIIEKEKKWFNDNSIIMTKQTRKIIREYLNSRIQMLTEECQKLEEAKKFIATVEEVTDKRKSCNK